MKGDVVKTPLFQLDFILLKGRYSSSPRILWCSTYLIFSQQGFALQKFYLCRGHWRWRGWAQDTCHSVSSRSNLYHFLAGLRWEPEPVQTEYRVPNFQLFTVLHTTEENVPVYYQGPGKIYLSFQIILIFKMLVLQFACSECHWPTPLSLVHFGVLPGMSKPSECCYPLGQLGNSSSRSDMGWYTGMWWGIPVVEWV